MAEASQSVLEDEDSQASIGVTDASPSATIQEESKHTSVNLADIPSDSEHNSDDEVAATEEIQGVEEENEVGYVRRRAYSVGVGNTKEDLKKFMG